MLLELPQRITFYREPKQMGKYFNAVYNNLEEVQSTIEKTKQVLTDDVKKRLC